MTDNNINRLAELLEKKDQMPFCTYKEEARWLLENGVIVPPCKVGDKVYTIFGGGILKPLKSPIPKQKKARNLFIDIMMRETNF